MAKIVSVYRPRGFDLVDMSGIRWLKISEALARAGHHVDMAIHGDGEPLPPTPNLSRVELAEVKWDEYDVVKTVFHLGFEVLEQYGGAAHPFIISKLGSVVGPRDMPGIYFYGRKRRRLYETQVRIARASKYVTLLSPQARLLWQECHSTPENLLLVPGGVDRSIPAPVRDPYPRDGAPRVLFAGNIYHRNSQPEANRVLVRKLNQLGKMLSADGIRLYILGIGDVSKLDRKHATYLGAVPYAASWDYLYFANVGIVVSAGPFMHNNESSKIYHYLRAGLPVVSEAGFPNDHVVREAQLGFIAGEGIRSMAEKIRTALDTPWDRQRAIDYILARHTWDKRVEIYNQILG